MPHTLVGADFAFTITVHMSGGAGAYADGHEDWMSYQEFLARHADGSLQEHAADPCAA